ncbi:RecQ family ATP-dependent DNA helicase [Campylobacter ureolyticus ACS-301-V-Sch3b]|uniref:DNA 3'-5' helicase n=1 Tax=Campylobacter ureolyticus ACS-301-V-Sch3b TaxID=883165 RepID=S3XGY0_9BACT|nr:RecQ family ATP-dependent DNA helicase [Campylobacter ureolyticus]EPH10089.1 RecQ family ATP-dependent DNA helicase [Campylobacter ureolyticus ACS-301-V-Sch3b]
MNEIIFIDTEIGKNDKKLYEFGAVFKDDSIKTNEILKADFFLKKHSFEFVCGHNFIDHDGIYLSSTILNDNLKDKFIIDTLFLSMLLFPNKKTHKLLKPYKTTLNIQNNPLGDAFQTKALFELLDAKFNSLNDKIKQIFINLLYENKYFNGYFVYKNLEPKEIDIYEIIQNDVKCKEDDILLLADTMPIELAFIISFLHTDRKAAISHIIINKFPNISWIIKNICFDLKSTDISKFALNEFGFNTFKEFENINEGLFKISQKDIINSTLNDNSILAILPTGGGKTFTFQLPALIKAQAYNALTVVISPLQALMKNHVDSFKEKNQNFSVKAISGYLSPVERSDIITQISNGTVDILYLAPEALRSNSIFNALKCRMIDRFVIDEAHCFSSWGHDFRHDYHYIATFINELNQSSNMQENIPVSCFTATAKPEVINDIKEYFFKNMKIEFDEFLASSKRENLEYEAIEVKDENEKYEKLIKTIQNLGKIPTIIYLPQNAKGCKELSQKLIEDARLEYLNLSIEPFYAKIDEEIELKTRKGRNKSEILKDFIDDKIDIVVATTAFGMGIDKPNIKAVIHYSQSDSLEAYLQESGRGARSSDIVAKCIILYQRDDFDKIFQKLNSNKIDAEEIQSIVKTLKNKKINPVYISPKTLAKNSGINLELDYENIVKTALLELERCEILKRDRDKYTICGSSLVDKEKRNMNYIRNLLESKKEKYLTIFNYMIMIMQNIIQKSKTEPVEIDTLSSNIGISNKDTFEAIYALQKENLINYDNDISVLINKKVKNEFLNHLRLENQIFDYILEKKKFDIRDIENKNSKKIIKIKKIIQSFSHLSKIHNQTLNVYFYNFFANIELEDEKSFKILLIQRQEICKTILFEILNFLKEDEKEIEFASMKLQSKLGIKTEFFHHCLVYLHQILKNFELRKGRLIYYKAYKIELLDKINENTPYQKRRDYNQTLAKYYERKIEAVHIQAKFLELLTNKDKSVSEFIKDYFSLEYEKFKKRYNFDKNIKLPITKTKLNQILSSLSIEQKAVFEDDKSNSIMVLAGPGSGKTKTLVHKIASLITKEGFKAEYFLMLAHSRTAVDEFKTRLKNLIGNQIYKVKIYTFHAFALNLLSYKYSEDELNNAIANATKALQNKDVELPLIQMLVLDEYQDIGIKSYEFIKEIYKNMPNDKKIIAVGDDDQCIMDFGDNKADIKFINEFKNDFSTNYKAYNLLTNYRSCYNLVSFSNAFRNEFKEKLKYENLISNSKNMGDIVLLQTNDYITNLLTNLDTDKQSAIIAKTNKEVLDIYSFLLQKNIKAKLLTDKNGFRLGNLIELRAFLEYFYEFSFKTALDKFIKNFNNSSNLALALEVIEKFQNEYDMNENEKYLKKAFKEFIEDIDFDEFENTKSNVTISTMHKAKGKEFDSVHLCFKDKIDNEYDKRLLYVAVTRAKKSLFIYSKNEIFLKYKSYFTKILDFKNSFYTPKNITLTMGLSDVNLSGYDLFLRIKKLNLQAGQEVRVDAQGIFSGEFCIGKFSQKFKKEIEKYETQGYKLNQKSKIQYIVVWYSKEKNSEFRIALCKLKMNL